MYHKKTYLLTTGCFVSYYVSAVPIFEVTIG